jgi:hypothetical protein
MPPHPPESAPHTSTASKEQEPSSPLLERLQGWVDRLLVLDVFLVLAAALWFGLGVVSHLRGADGILTAFQHLWFPLFQPALGVLMLSAIVSGGLGWWRRRGQR